MFEIYKKAYVIYDVYKRPIYNKGDTTIGSKSMRQFTPRYSNIVEEFCISLCLFRECSLISFFPQISKESHDEVFI